MYMVDARWAIGRDRIRRVSNVTESAGALSLANWKMNTLPYGSDWMNKTRQDRVQRTTAFQGFKVAAGNVTYSHNVLTELDLWEGYLI